MYPPDAVVLSCLHSLPAPSLLACHRGELPVSKQNLTDMETHQRPEGLCGQICKLALWPVFGFGD